MSNAQQFNIQNSALNILLLSVFIRVHLRLIDSLAFRPIGISKMPPTTSLVFRLTSIVYRLTSDLLRLAPGALLTRALSGPILSPYGFTGLISERFTLYASPQG